MTFWLQNRSSQQLFHSLMVVLNQTCGRIRGQIKCSGRKRLKRKINYEFYIYLDLIFLYRKFVPKTSDCNHLVEKQYARLTFHLEVLHSMKCLKQCSSVKHGKLFAFYPLTVYNIIKWFRKSGGFQCKRSLMAQHQDLPFVSNTCNHKGKELLWEGLVKHCRGFS